MHIFSFMHISPKALYLGFRCCDFRRSHLHKVFTHKMAMRVPPSGAETFSFDYEPNPEGEGIDLKSEIVWQRPSPSPGRPVAKAKEFFRCVVQCFILREEDGLFLMGQMPYASNTEFVFPVQGGVRRGQGLLQAAQRKLRDELGLDMNRDLEILSLAKFPSEGDTDYPLGQELLLREMDAVGTEGGVSDEASLGGAAYMTELIELFRPHAFLAYRREDHEGCVGQCVFPLLFRVRPASLLKVNLLLGVKDDQAAGTDSAALHRQFKDAFWVPLPLVDSKAATKKQEVMRRVRRGLEWCVQQHYTADTVPKSLRYIFEGGAPVDDGTPLRMFEKAERYTVEGEANLLELLENNERERDEAPSRGWRGGRRGGHRGGNRGGYRGGRGGYQR